jgi:hypothetical protein
MTNSAVMEIVNHAASQSDRWLFVALLVVFILGVIATARYVIRDRDRLIESLGRLHDRSDNLTREVSQVVATNTAALNEMKTWCQRGRGGLVALIVCLVLAGCGVPSTRIRYNPASHQLTLTSPKDVTIGGINVIMATNGQFSLNVTNYAATNNAAVISAVSEQNAMILRTIADTTTKIISKTP